ncbi:DNA integrity scanning protein DisA nucleotide-binding domain protein [Mycoplasmopsis citelli]|uniref:Membrane protein n=1 Tax=Mycoplasmopsis citelli TaxID=171281 RepID=A0A449B342_9BACT|nr:DNA integrity scanning protein DisA nucleotide-binding domain protein [Mycoplasmopsis citelli]UUD36398.1 DNA integrity scanning protein DisA nucleotide-binding domain protein [Mycoplasmopsis citelli]VEU75017.1 membrane protein [Mycoplasmopsis citelli]
MLVIFILLIVLLTFWVAIAILLVLLWPRISNFISKKIVRNKYLSLGKSSQERLIYELKDTVEYLSKRKIGALITLENNENLDNLRTDGIILNANLSSSLLIAIFNKDSPIHDGAVIIRDNKIYYASTFYKITKKSVDNSYGSRHRAALGISEQSDATTIVVSEESGAISILKGGLMTKVPISEFKETLLKYIKD